MRRTPCVCFAASTLSATAGACLRRPWGSRSAPSAKPSELRHHPSNPAVRAARFSQRSDVRVPSWTNGTNETDSSMPKSEQSAVCVGPEVSTGQLMTENRLGRSQLERCIADALSGARQSIFHTAVAEFIYSAQYRHDSPASASCSFVRHWSACLHLTMFCISPDTQVGELPVPRRKHGWGGSPLRANGRAANTPDPSTPSVSRRFCWPACRRERLRLTRPDGR